MTAAECKLAILMPTYRFDEMARQALQLAAGIGDDEICVLIGDNSENPEKHQFLRDLAARSRNVEVTCHPKNIGAFANWMFLIESRETEFVTLAADDDAFTSSYFKAGLRLISADADCSAASGLHIGIATGSDVPDLYAPAQRLESSPLARIERYHGQNPMAYAIVRKSVLKGFADYIRAHPISVSFSDYLLTFHLLSIGTYKMDYDGYGYLYNNNNWSSLPKFFQSAGSFYAMSGLSAGFGVLARLHWAVVNLHFFRSRFRHPGLSEKEASEIAIYLYERFRNDFRYDYTSQRAEIDSLIGADRDAAQILQGFVKDEFESEALVFERFSRLLATFSPELAARYHTFLTTTLVSTPMVIAPPAKRTWLSRWRRR